MISNLGVTPEQLGVGKSQNPATAKTNERIFLARLKEILKVLRGDKRKGSR